MNHVQFPHLSGLSHFGNKLIDFDFEGVPTFRQAPSFATQETSLFNLVPFQGSHPSVPHKAPLGKKNSELWEGIVQGVFVAAVAVGGLILAKQKIQALALNALLGGGLDAGMQWAFAGPEESFDWGRFAFGAAVSTLSGGLALGNSFQKAWQLKTLVNGALLKYGAIDGALTGFFESGFHTLRDARHFSLPLDGWALTRNLFGGALLGAAFGALGMGAMGAFGHVTKRLPAVIRDPRLAETYSRLDGKIGALEARIAPESDWADLLDGIRGLERTSSKKIVVQARSIAHSMEKTEARVRGLRQTWREQGKVVDPELLTSVFDTIEHRGMIRKLDAQITRVFEDSQAKLSRLTRGVSSDHTPHPRVAPADVLPTALPETPRARGRIRRTENRPDALGTFDRGLQTAVEEKLGRSFGPRGEVTELEAKIQRLAETVAGDPFKGRPEAVARLQERLRDLRETHTVLERRIEEISHSRDTNRRLKSRLRNIQREVGSLKEKVRETTTAVQTEHETLLASGPFKSGGETVRELEEMGRVARAVREAQAANGALPANPLRQAVRIPGGHETYFDLTRPEANFEGAAYSILSSGEWVELVVRGRQYGDSFLGLRARREWSAIHFVTEPEASLLDKHAFLQRTAQSPHRRGFTAESGSLHVHMNSMGPHTLTDFLRSLV